MSPYIPLTIASAEGQLLLTCARGRLTPEHTLRLQDLAAGRVDWELLLQAAEVQGLEPLLCWHLTESAGDALSPPLQERLQTRFARHARSNLLLSGELGKILGGLEAGGIPALAYKGPALATILYGNLALREFSDLDLLVEPRNVLPAKELLLAAGYRETLELTPRQQAAHLKSGCELSFVSADGHVAVELHWRLAPRHFSAEPAMQEFFARGRPVQLAGTEVRTLAPEDLLLALAVHAAKHVWRGLGWICDVGELLRVFPALDWTAIEGRARALGLERVLHLSLQLARELLDAPLPAEVRSRIAADREIQSMTGELRQRSLLEVTGLEWSVPDHRFFLRARERRGDRLRYVLRLAMTPGAAEWQSVRLPEFLFPLYPAVRLARLAAKGVRP